MGMHRIFLDVYDLMTIMITGLKSHDSHVLMQQLLPIAVRGKLPGNVVQPLVRMSAHMFNYVDIR
jgi:hypothetical protein